MRAQKFIVVLFLLICSAMGNQVSFEEIPKKTMNREITLKKGAMELFFKDLLHQWERDGIYLFIEQKETLKLFYINEMGVELFQYPRMKESRWINPEAYLNERERKASEFNIDRCHHQIADGNIFLSLKKFSLEWYPQISVMRDWLGFSQIGNIQYSGFVKEGPNVSNFYFNDFRGEDVVLKKPLDRLIPLYDLLKKQPFDAYMDDCK